VIIIAILSFSCSKDANDSEVSKEVEKEELAITETILLIGNSHTYYNEGIATHLKRFTENDNVDDNPLIKDIAKAGYTLQEHFTDPATIEKIQERSWDIIILQENTLIASQESSETVESMKAIADLVSQKGTKIYLFMTWPYKDMPEMLPPIERIYSQGALEIGATIIPVGRNWMSVNDNEDVAVNLYDQDGFHPSREGTFYATAKFYRTLYKKPPSDNPYKGGLGEITANYLKTRAN
jgi:hypothetical protein